MQISRNKNRHTLIITVVTLIVLGTGVAYAYKNGWLGGRQESFQKSDEGPIDYGAPTDEEIKAGNEAKKESLEDKSKQTSTHINITSVNQTDTLLQVRTTIAPATSSGKCTLSVTRENSEIYFDDAEVQQLGSYSVCQGFDIPLSGLEKGNWLIKVTYTSPEGVSSEANNEVRVN